MNRRWRDVGLGVVLAALVALGLYETRLAQSAREELERQRGERLALITEHARLRAEFDALSAQSHRGDRQATLGSERLRELLRLRGEVGQLRQERREWQAKLATASAGLNPGSSAEGAGRATTSAVAGGTQALFRVQRVLEPGGANAETRTGATGQGDEAFNLDQAPLLDTAAIQTVGVTVNPDSGAAQIDVQFSDVGAELFAAVTRENLNQRLAIVLDGKVVAAPVIRTEITGGRAQISGSFTVEEAQALAARIRQAIPDPALLNPR